MQRVSVEGGVHRGTTVKRSADRRLNRSSCGRLIRMYVPHCMGEVEQVRFIQRALASAGEDAGARQRRSRAEECGSLRGLVRRHVRLHELPAFVLDPDLASDPQVTLAPHGHGESLRHARIDLWCRHECEQGRPRLGARLGHAAPSGPRLEGSGIGNRTYAVGVIGLKLREASYFRVTARLVR